MNLGRKSFFATLTLIVVSVLIGLGSDIGKNDAKSFEEYAPLLFFMKQSGWVCDCEKRVPIEISGNTQALTDYQVKIQIPDLPEINGDYSNVLFTTSDQTTQIDHWVQTSNASNGIAWVEIPSIPIAGTTIYMYYGNCGSSGNPSNVFEYYNDFGSSAGINNLRNGGFSTETYKGKTVLRKEGNCDPHGAEIPLGFTIDDFILITQETRPNDGTSLSRCGLNRYGLENSSYDGYTIVRNGHSGSYFGVERRDNHRGGNSARVNLNPRTAQDTFIISELRRCCALNQNQAQMFSTRGESLALVSHTVNAHNYCNFDRITIRGGIDYLIDYMAVAKNSCNPPSSTFGIPEIDGPEALCQNINVPITAAGTATISTGDVDNSSSDNCDNSLSLSLSNTSFTCSNLGTSMTVLTVTDDQGNTSTCASTLTIVDNIAPSITCANDTTIIADPGACSKNNIALNSPLVSDNCNISSISNNLASTVAVGMANVIWTVSDGSGNTNTCVQVITVADTVAPVIICPDTLSITTGAGACDTTGLTLSGTIVSDECGVMSTINDAPSTFPRGFTTVTWTSTDVNGNTSSCQQVIEVTDGEPPSITCGPTVRLKANADCKVVNVMISEPANMDNCAIAILANNAPVPTEFPIGTTTLTWEVTDENNNSATCNQTIIVEDEIKPEVTCPDTIKVNVNPGTCLATIEVLPTPTVNENCTVNMSTNNAPAPFPLGLTSFIWTVTDDAGNTGTCAQVVKVSDNENPMITCPMTVNVNADLNSCTSSSVSLGTPMTSDNCMVSTTLNDALLTAYPVGTTVINWTVTDNSGNTATCTQSVVVTDNQNPMISCQDTVREDADFGLCTTSKVTLQTPLTSDECGIDTVFNNAPSTYPIGNTNIIWTVRDVNGNTNTCMTVVNISDVEAPQLICPPDTSLSCNSSAPPSITGEPTAFDYCGNVTVTHSDSIEYRSPAFPEKYTIHREWSVTDESGNIALCTQVIVLCPEPIPTMNEWGKMILLLLLMIIGVVSITSRHKQSVKRKT